MEKKLLTSISILIVFAGIAIPFILRATQNAKEELERQRLIREEKRVYLLGKFDPALNKNFIKIPLQYTMTNTEMYLRKETFKAFVEMRTEALKDKITLNIASATRNFDYQKIIWEKKWNGLTLVDGKKLSESIPDGIERFRKILEYSAAPSTSRHHWGADIDINGADPTYFNSVRGKKEYVWLAENAQRFGFCQPYNSKEGRENGYNEEKWHWSYMPIAQELLKEYVELIEKEDITGFAGDVYVKDFDLLSNYILSINLDCF